MGAACVGRQKQRVCKSHASSCKRRHVKTHFPTRGKPQDDTWLQAFPRVGKSETAHHQGKRLPKQAKKGAHESVLRHTRIVVATLLSSVRQTDGSRRRGALRLLCHRAASTSHPQRCRQLAAANALGQSRHTARNNLSCLQSVLAIPHAHRRTQVSWHE